MKILIIPVSYCYPFYKNSASERFRCDWLLPYLGADKYNRTQDLDSYDVIIYQKAHSEEAVKIAKRCKDKIQIFDTTDPEWLFPEGTLLKDLIGNMTFVTTSTEGLAKGLRQFGKPTYVIPERHEFNFYKSRKVHEDKEPVLVWFGYSENFERIRPLLPIIKAHNLKLTVICDRPVGFGKFVEWKLETVNDEIIKGDIVLNLPDQYGFKSNNKTTTAWILGMPVVEKVSDLFRFLNYKERVREAKIRLKEIRLDYNISKSADRITNLIKMHEVNKNEN